MASFTLINCTASCPFNYSAQQEAQTLYIQSTFDQSFDPTIGETPSGARY